MAKFNINSIGEQVSIIDLKGREYTGVLSAVDKDQFCLQEYFKQSVTEDKDGNSEVKTSAHPNAQKVFAPNSFLYIKFKKKGDRFLTDSSDVYVEKYIAKEYHDSIPTSKKVPQTLSKSSKSFKPKTKQPSLPEEPPVKPESKQPGGRRELTKTVLPKEVDPRVKAGFSDMDKINQEDQFKWNKKFGYNKTGYTDEQYTTKLNTDISDEVLKKAEQIEKEMRNDTGFNEEDGIDEGEKNKKRKNKKKSSQKANLNRDAFGKSNAAQKREPEKAYMTDSKTLLGLGIDKVVGDSQKLNNENAIKH